MDFFVSVPTNGADVSPLLEMMRSHVIFDEHGFAERPRLAQWTRESAGQLLLLPPEKRKGES